MTNGSFVKAVSANSRLPVYLVNASDEKHGMCWYYLEVDNAKHDMFRKTAAIGQKFTFTDFGRVVTSGWGAHPPQATVELLRSEGVIDG